MAFEAGAISLAAIRALFGGATPDRLSEYYRGAGYVANAAPNLGVPASGAISFSQFRGTSGASPFTASANIGIVSGSTAPTHGTATATSGAVVVSATGGSPAYAYVWSWVSGDVLTVTSPNSYTTTFSLAHTAIGGYTASSVYRCRVTDSTLAYREVDVTVALTFVDSPLSAVIAPSNVSGTARGVGTKTATSSTAGATPSGGAAPYTYAWTRNGGGSGVINISNPSAASTAFWYAHSTSGDPSYTDSFTCTVTDADGHTASGVVTVDLSFVYDSGV